MPALIFEDNEDIDWKALTKSIDQQRDFIGWLATNLDAVADRTGYENIDVLRFVLDRLGSISQSLTSDHVSLLVLAVRQAFDQNAAHMDDKSEDESAGRGASGGVHCATSVSMRREQRPAPRICTLMPAPLRHMARPIAAGTYGPLWPGCQALR